MKKIKVNAYLNHGRWLIDCPKCRQPLRVINEEEMYCPVCWPGVQAKAMAPLGNGTFRPVPDLELITQAKAQAAAKGECYLPVFPKERGEIERLTRLRPLEWFNWTNETVAMLKAENIELGFEEA